MNNFLKKNLKTNFRKLTKDLEVAFFHLGILDSPARILLDPDDHNSLILIRFRTGPYSPYSPYASFALV